MMLVEEDENGETDDLFRVHHIPNPDFQRLFQVLQLPVCVSSSFFILSAQLQHHLRLPFFFFFNLLHQCLHHRAVNPSAPLPPIEPWLKAALERPEVISERCRAPLEQIKKNFPLTEVEKKKPLKTSAQIYGKE